MGLLRLVPAREARQELARVLHVCPILVAEPFQQHRFLSLHALSKQNVHRRQSEAD